MTLPTFIGAPSIIFRKGAGGGGGIIEIVHIRGGGRCFIVGG